MPSAGLIGLQHEATHEATHEASESVGSAQPPNGNATGTTLVMAGTLDRPTRRPLLLTIAFTVLERLH